MIDQFKELFRMIRIGGQPKGVDALYNLDDVKRCAEKRLPKMIYDFIGGGAYDEITMASNKSDFSRITFRPKMLADVTRRNYRVRVLGQELEFPVLISPAGLLRLAHPEGELAMAKAAGKTGVVFIVSTAASYSIKEIAASAPGPLWFQLYLWSDRDVIRSLVDLAEEAGCSALVVTVDLPVIGKRERDLRNGLSIPPQITLQSVRDVLQHPSWLWDFLRSPPVIYKNFEGLAEGDHTMSHSSFLNQHLINASAGWSDLDRLRQLWKGPLVVKGIMTPEDAKKAVECGADGIMVSNHGGRQLDGLPSTIRILPDIAEAVEESADIILDGGIRRGSDVIKAIALGAKAVMTARSWIWGLAAAGQMGVERVQAILAEEIDQTMALLGCSNLTDLDQNFVDLTASWKG